MAVSGNKAENDAAPTLETLQYQDEFVQRHIGPSAAQIADMLAVLNLDSLEQLVANTVPASIALKKPLALGAPMTESAALARLKNMARKNKPTRSFIGLGYYDTYTPNVILRNVIGQNTTKKPTKM